MSPRANNLEAPKSGRVTELFPYAMPFKAAQAIGLLVILICAAVGLGAVLVDWPETVQAPFVLLPESGSDPILSPFAGVLESVRANTRGDVEENAVLFTIRSSRIQELSAERRTLEKDLSALAQRREAAEETHTINRNLQDAEINQREREVSFRKQHLEVYRTVLERMESLSAQGLYSSVDLLLQQLGQAESERDAALAAEQLNAAKLALSRLDSDYRQSLDRIASEETRLTVQLEGLAAQLRDVTDDLVVVRSPYQGVILSVARKRVGDVVSVGQELCQIAPVDTPTRAHLQLAEQGMALLREGQSVKLLFEAFPYQRYGVVEGELSWLSPAAIMDKERDQFVAQVTPAQFTIGAGERAQPLRVGMGGVARIQVGRRTLIEYAFEPLRRLRENMRDQEALPEGEVEKTERAR